MSCVVTSGRLPEKGFTILELLISMAIGIFLLAGLSMLFVAFSKTGAAVNQRTERMSDLYLASHVMQEGLRESLNKPSSTVSILGNLAGRKVALPAGYPAVDALFVSLPWWDAASKTITYQNLEGDVGIFQYQRGSNDRIYWLRPGFSKFEELIRGLDAQQGMNVVGSGGKMMVTLNASYFAEDRSLKRVVLSFTAWARN